MNERFATAAGQLGDDRPPAVRLAGVYAMAGLADDRPENQQTCVDVLCAYLRMPYEPDPGEDALGPARLAFGASREVRHTVNRVITAHLQDGATKSWQGLDFDFRGAVFDHGDFFGAVFSGGWVGFGRAEFSSGVVSFGGAKFSGAEVNFGDTKFSGGWVDFSRAGFSGGLVDFAGAEFSGGTVDFGGAEFSGGEVRFVLARFSGGKVSFHDAKFSDSRVDFLGAEFSSGSEVDFSRPGDWSRPPAFHWTGTPPPCVKLPKKEDQSPGQLRQRRVI